MRNKIVIVKVQVALFSGKPDMVIHDERRSFFFQQPVTKEIMKLMDGSYRDYFYAQIKDGELTIGGKAPQQEW